MKTQQNIQEAANTMLRGTFITTNAYIKKEQGSSSFTLRNRKEEQVYSKQAKGRLD